MARWIVFTDNVFWKYSWAHVVISTTVAFLCVMQCRLRARRSRASSMVFRPWPLRTEIVPDSLNLWMILCTVDDDNFKLFAIFLWETPFWYCSTIFAAALGELVILFPSWLLRDTATLRGSFYTQSCCKLVLQLFLICTFNFSGLLLLPVPTFWECVALMKSKMSQYLAWHFKMSHFQHLICYLYSIVNKIVYEICKLLHFFFIHNLYSVPTFLESGLYKIMYFQHYLFNSVYTFIPPSKAESLLFLFPSTVLWD